MPRLARRITSTSAKDFGMFARAHGRGGDLIHLELGRPVEDTPAHIKEATIAALRAGHVHYSDLQGLPALRSALARRLAERDGLDYGPDEIIVTNGLTQGAFAAAMALLEEGDEAILIGPHYPQHVGKVELAGARVVLAATDAAAGFRLRPELIAAHVTDRTRAVFLVNPCNPTGRVYGRDELEGLARLAVARDLVVISDEVYADIVYDGARHVAIAGLPGMRSRTIGLHAFTKAYAMDGWRLGYIAADRAFTGALLKVTTNEVTHVNTFIQHGALAAVTGPAAVLEGLVDGDRRRRDLVVARLNQMPGVRCPAPEGAIYAFPDIRATGLSARDAALRILEETGVVVEAGSFYGPAGEGHLRICFGAEPEHRLAEAMDRLQAFFNRL
ncbi:MAG: aminotransferase class I/II-fold pyridoxal phosphate-dependent enzyme [Rhodobacteraceae bacterium]|jgi:aspartate aminotransferase|nr:aminotransferase class I/II-fold pyridoxal phosphate-dependent enzyme [Paracoccaceae bacterium]